MEFTTLFMWNGVAVAGFMAVLWLASLLKKDASIVDIFWGIGFVLVAWLGFFLSDGFFARRLLVALCVSLWGARLAVYIFTRNHGQGEDYRYQEMRKKAGDGFWWKSLFFVFGLQGVFLLIISLPVQVAQSSPLPQLIVWTDIAGVAVWAVGLLCEAFADRQLAAFKADPGNRGKVMDRGLWRYSRHPNYFGESLIWWGMYLLALSTPEGAWSAAGPLLITFLLLRVSGVALLEKNLKVTKPQYADYIKNTSAFVPWFPKKGVK